MKNIEKRGMEAAEKYLIRKGYEVESVDYDKSMIVAIDDDFIAFVNVSTRLADEEGFRDPQYTREGFEKYAINWLAGRPDLVNIGVRPDSIAIAVIGDEQALLRHHIKCFA